MKNKIIILLSIVLIFVCVIFIIHNLKNKESSFTGQEKETSEETVEQTEEVIINKYDLVDSIDEKFIEDAKIENNKVFSYVVQDDIEEGVSDQYLDMIISITGESVDRYWVVPIDNVSEKLYWYDSNKELQSYIMSY